MRKIALLSMDYIRPKDPSIPLGIASIMANLKKNNIQFEKLLYNVKDNIEVGQIIDDIMKVKATDIMIGAYVWNENYVQQIIKKISPYKRIVIGGPQVSYVGINELEKYYPEANVFIRGHAEQAVVEYAKKNDKFYGIHTANNKDYNYQASVDIKKLPSPLTSNIMNPKDFVRWETQRGCSYACSFCQHRDASNSGVSKLNQNRINEEIEWLKENKINDIAILDPTFNADTLHSSHILSILPNAKVSLQVRPEKLNKTFLDAVTKSKADITLELGVQTLNPNELGLIDRIKGANNEKVIEKVKSKLLLAESYGVKTMISLMYGLPEQTVDSFSKTLDWCKTNTNANVVSYPLMLLRGTPLYYKKKELGLQEKVVHIDMSNQNRISHNIPHVIKTPTMSEDDWWKITQMTN